MATEKEIRRESKEEPWHELADEPGVYQKTYILPGFEYRLTVAPDNHWMVQRVDREGDGAVEVDAGNADNREECQRIADAAAMADMEKFEKR